MILQSEQRKHLTTSWGFEADAKWLMSCRVMRGRQSVGFLLKRNFSFGATPLFVKVDFDELLGAPEWAWRAEDRYKLGQYARYTMY